MKRLVLRILVAVVTIVVSAYLLGVFIWGSHQANDNSTQQLEIDIEDIEERQFISAQDIISLLQRKGVYPVGKTMDSVHTHVIENVIRQHPMVRTVECYKLSSPTVRICITQRIPLLYVKTDAESYMVDTDYKRMPIPNNMGTPPIRVTGHVGERMAREEIANFVYWLNRQPYWRKRIAYIQVNSPKFVTLYQKGDEPRILLGNLTDYADKLHRLRIWYEKMSNYPDIPHYYELDLRYCSQVIGRK